jgi:heme A synthase
MGWPLWRTIPNDLHPSLQVVRLGLAAIAAVLVLATVVTAARSARLRPWGIALGVLFVAEMGLGLVIRAEAGNLGVATAYSVIAVSLLWCLGLLFAVAGAVRTVPDAPQDQDPSERELAEPAHR